MDNQERKHDGNNSFEILKKIKYVHCAVTELNSLIIFRYQKYFKMLKLGVPLQVQFSVNLFNFPLKNFPLMHTFYVFGGLACVGRSFAYICCPISNCLRDVWIRTQRAAVASMCAQPPISLPNIVTHLPHQLSRPSP
jgi:hypothetical protein